MVKQNKDQELRKRVGLLPRNHFTRMGNGWCVTVVDGAPKRGSLVDVWRKGAEKPEQVKVNNLIDEGIDDGVRWRRYSIFDRAWSQRPRKLQRIFDDYHRGKIDKKEFVKRRQEYFEAKYPNLKKGK